MAAFSSTAQPLSDLIESTVIRSLCPKHLFSFTGFRRGMKGLRKDLERSPPSDEKRAHVLTVFPPSSSIKMDEQRWMELEDLIENPRRHRYERYCYDWSAYALACCQGCSLCSIYCDAHQRQGAYSLIHAHVLEASDNFVEQRKVRMRNPPLLRMRIPDLVPSVIPDDDVLNCACCGDGPNLQIPFSSPYPPSFEPQSFFDQQDGDSDDERPF